MKFSATIENDSPEGHRTLQLASLEPAKVAEVISSMRDDWSTTLDLASDKHRLCVSASEGQYAVLAIVGDDEFYDLLGDPTEAGWTKVVHGGQAAEHPRRHCVGEERVKEVVESFLSTGQVDLKSFAWEPQGEFQK